MPLIPPLLRRPTFRNFWLGQTISVFGDQITLLAIPIVAVLTLNADPEQMGLLTAVGLLPHLLFSLPAGVWLDKVHRRRRLMIIADLLRAVVIATIAITYMMGNLSLPQLFLVTFVVGSLAVVFEISWNTLFVTIAERDEYLSANALFSGSRSLAGVAGPSIGGALIQFLTAPIAILVDAISYVGSALFLSRVNATEPPVVPTSEPIRAQLTTGLAFIFRDPIMRPTIMSAATLNFFNFGFPRAIHPVRDDVSQHRSGLARPRSGRWRCGGRSRSGARRSSRPSAGPRACLRVRPRGFPGGAHPRAARGRQHAIAVHPGDVVRDGVLRWLRSNGPRHQCRSDHPRANT